MDDEFKLCWKNFQDNIASGFQSLYDRGDLVDVTLACDGKLLQAHKIVLAICSPYFQEIFITNPCKHPIIILKDVSYNIMCELLEFMYQGVVNVKHTELQAFMKIGQLLQIKGLATNSSSSGASTSSEKSLNNNQQCETNDGSVLKTLTSAAETASSGENSNIGVEKSTENNSNPNTPHRSQSPILSPAISPMHNSNSLKAAATNQASKLTESQQSQQQLSTPGSSSSGLKRHSDYISESLSIYSRNKHRRSIPSTDHSSENTDGPDSGSVSGAIEQMNTEDFFLPHISMVESRYELNNIKRENSEHHLNSSMSSAAAAAAAASTSLRNSFNTAAFGLDYSFYKNNSASSHTGQEYPNELHISNEYSKSFANHMDIPSNCPNVVMLSSTSLLHGNCVFNRNNTVATQQGMKTYWLCKSYRISMCRARCITHQGKIISATGVHNHTPHMRGNNASGSSTGNNLSGSSASANANSSNNTVGSSSHTGNSTGGGALISSNSSGAFGLRYSQNGGPTGNNQNYHDHHHSATATPQTVPPSNYITNPHIHSGNTSNTSNAAPSSHLFLQSMPNLLVQHYPSGQSTHVMQQPPFTPQHNILHNYEIAPTMQSSPSNPSNDHSRNINSSFDSNEKTLDALNKDHLNDEHIPVHNEAALSPTGLQNTGIKPDHVASLTHANEIGKKLPSPDHHQVQVIDSITISPGNGHGFKMESM